MNNTVLFYTQNRWAFGQIHHALTKHLWKYGVYSNLLDWVTVYSQKEHDYFKRCYKVICTMPDAVHHLVKWGWGYNRIIAVAHSERDLTLAVANSGTEMFDKLKQFAVVNKDLVVTSKELGILRIPTVVPVGLDTRHFNGPLPANLKVIGYAGAKISNMSDGTDFKRGHLVEEIAKQTNLVFKPHEFYHHFAMPGYYQDIDALVVSSTYETVGLPALEAAAAGRLVLSTEVGYFDGSYGVKCRMDAEDFKTDVLKALNHFSSDTKAFRMACINFRKAVQDNHDWEKLTPEWVSLFE